MKKPFAATLLLQAGLCWPASTADSHTAEFLIFWGDVHGHTELSDGRGSVDDYFTYARDIAGLDFVILTDHDFGHAAPWRLPTNHWRLIQNKADEFTVSGRFVAIAGYEWTSQPKYWTEPGKGTIAEGHFPGPARFFNHKIVYLPSGVDYLFSAKEAAFMDPDRLAEAVRQHGGLIHNAHPDAGPGGRDQFDYAASNAAVMANSEMLADNIRYQGTNYPVKGEQTLRAFLNRGGKTGFVGGSDTHEGTPKVRTAVLTHELSRAAIFDALRHRRNYAVSHVRIGLDFRIDGHVMGETIPVSAAPRIVVEVKGTAPIRELALIRNGQILRTRRSSKHFLRFEHVDRSFAGASYYYVRVTQQDQDEHGNPSRAWSSPIWVTSK